MNKKGFTIVELLIVIVVIGILAAITIVSFNGVTARARDTQRVQDAENIVKALEIYKVTNGVYPSANSTPNAQSWEVSTTGSAATNFLSPLVTSKVVSKIPVDPKNTADPLDLNPDWAKANFMYFYYLYPAGASGCDSSRGQFFVFGITRFDSVASGQPAASSPRFKCGTGDWTYFGAWVTGGFTN